MLVDISINIIVEHGNEHAAAQFYQTALGFIEQSRAEIDGSLASITMRAGNLEFIIAGANPNREAEPSRGGPFFIKQPGATNMMFTLNVDDVNTAYDTAIRSGASSRSNIDITEDGRHAATLFDPFGHIWALLEKRGNMSKAA